VGGPWRLLLAAGDGVAALRWWARWSWWASHRTPREKLRALRELARYPAKLVREARAEVATYGAAVAERSGISPRRQLLALCWLRARHGIRPVNYYRFQLFRPERRASAARYVQGHDGNELVRVLMRRLPPESRAPFTDKRRFVAWCAEHGFPCVATIAEFVDGRPVRGEGLVLPTGDLFSKPANWQGGHGVQRWAYAGGCYVGEDARPRTASALVAELSAASAEQGRPILLQRFLRNHPQLDPLAPVALSTIRMVTVRPPAGDARFLVGVFRMASGGAAADNFDLGGLAAQVDVETGRLGKAVRKYGTSCIETVERHPDTGAPIERHQLPFWGEAMRLVVRAHQAVDAPLPVIGWDVALLPDGPLLVEGNNVPCTVGLQMPEGVPLGDTPYAACLTAHLRASFGIGG
jgi:hypothetical protein